MGNVYFVGLVLDLTSLYYGSIGLIISIVEQRLVKVSCIEFQQNL
jgi:hypothetical protein